ncbi:putative reverse transcriptase domain-containing protein [Tanacetum coccineum]
MSGKVLGIRGKVMRYLRVHGERTQGVVKPNEHEGGESKVEWQIVVIEALRRKERVKPRRVRAMAMTIQYGSPQADGQSERMIQTLEDITRACVIDFGGSYHLSIRCAPFEALYGRKCSVGKGKPKAARDRQKSYVDYRRKPLEFEVGDRVLLKVTPWKGVVCFGKKGKLEPRYVGPFEILERICLVAYRLRLHEELNSVHDTFHVCVKSEEVSGGC